MHLFAYICARDIPGGLALAGVASYGSRQLTHVRPTAASTVRRRRNVASARLQLAGRKAWSKHCIEGAGLARSRTVAQQPAPRLQGARMRALGTAAGVALSLYNHPASVAVSTDGTQIAISAHEVVPLSTAGTSARIATY